MKPTTFSPPCCSPGCASGNRYQDKKMDFGAIKTVAVLPLQNLSRDNLAGERVRDVFSTMLLSTGAVYVLPVGEVNRALVRGNVTARHALAGGGRRARQAPLRGCADCRDREEYGEVRSGNSAANAISMSLEMFETQTGKVVWAASTTKGGIGFWDRMLGGGGEPMNKVTEDAVRDLLNKLFK